MSNDNKTNLKASHRANSSLDSIIVNMPIRSKRVTKYLPNPKFVKNDVTGVITHFFIKQAVATDDNKRYYSRTAIRSGAKPSPQSLAIFVSKTDLINTQQVTTDMNNNVTRSNRYTYGTEHSDVSYDGLSEPNTIPFLGNKFRRLNAIVNDPFYPFFIFDHKQTKRSGGYHA